MAFLDESTVLPEAPAHLLVLERSRKGAPDLRLRQPVPRLLALVVLVPTLVSVLPVVMMMRRGAIVWPALVVLVAVTAVLLYSALALLSGVGRRVEVDEAGLRLAPGLFPPGRSRRFRWGELRGVAFEERRSEGRNTLVTYRVVAHPRSGRPVELLAFPPPFGQLAWEVAALLEGLRREQV